MKKTKLNKQLVQLSIYTSILGLTWLIISIFWIEIKASWSFFGSLIYGFIIIAWVFYLIKSLLFVFKEFGSLKFKSLVPLLILLLSFLLVISIDPVLADFYLRFESYGKAVVVSLESNNLEVTPEESTIDVDRNIPVAKSIKMARDDRGITVFFTRDTIGFGDHEVGYIYRSDNSESKIYNSSDLVPQKIKEHWFWGINPFDWSLKKSTK